MQPGVGLRPHADLSSVLDIPFKELGKPFVILDVDNTLVATRTRLISVETVEFFKDLRAKGIIKDMCLLSNGGIRKTRQNARLAYLADILQAHHIGVFGLEMKPAAHGFLEAMKHMGSTPETTVMVGDQLYTDILGANQLGIYTVCVRPFSRDHFLTWPKRILEKRHRKGWQLPD
jgi:HAD superfamily phosphatase (TIGR01668 family)